MVEVVVGGCKPIVDHMSKILVTLSKIGCWMVALVPIYDHLDKIPLRLAHEPEPLVKFAICLGTYDQDPCNLLKNQVVAGRAPGQGPVLPAHDFVEAEPPLLMSIWIFIGKCDMDSPHLPTTIII